MTSQFDVLTLFETVARDNQSGKLSCDLLTQGQTLYGKSADFPDYLERIMPDGKKSLAYWRNGEFQQIISLL
tara:strand:- start:66 stop:281 length:216 start_codon:yes stop_codon:yes gene_type:complete